MGRRKECIDNFFKTGYVIRLGSNEYFQKIKDRKIHTSKVWNARFFGSMQEAESFAQKHLWYAGMDPQICYRAWILVSSNNLEDDEEFWDGKQFSGDIKKAKLFTFPQEVRMYAAKHNLTSHTYTDLLPVEQKQIKNAA